MNLKAALDTKAETSHSHDISDINNLQSTLDSKADASTVTEIQTTLDTK